MIGFAEWVDGRCDAVEERLASVSIRFKDADMVDCTADTQSTRPEGISTRSRMCTRLKGQSEESSVSIRSAQASSLTPSQWNSGTNKIARRARMGTVRQQSQREKQQQPQATITPLR